MSQRFLTSASRPAFAAGVLRWAWIAGFLFLVGRFWEPHLGVTAFLQANEETEATLPAPLRDGPIHIHRGQGRYDGAYYAVIATDPTLRDPALNVAVHNLGYRARRILLPAVAWAAGGGEPVAVVHAYAWLNVLLWLVLAWLAWRIFPVADGARATGAWLAVLSGGALLSVRLALTDLAALVLLAAAVPALARGRTGLGTTLLGLAGLARETALLGVAALLPGAKPREPGRWWPRLALAGLASVPLAVWLWYIRLAPDLVSPGIGNFSLPLAGLAGRFSELWRLPGEGADRGALVLAWLAHGALLVQIAAMVRWREPGNPWWRLGALHALLALVLGAAVWEGLPGAAVRVLLPLALAFNVLAVQRRAAWAWLLAGNLMLGAGLGSMLSPPLDPQALPVHRGSGYSVQVETDARWSAVERGGKWRWAWCANEGGLVVHCWPHASEVRLELQLRGVTPRPVEVLHAGRVVWAGEVGDRPQWITLPALPATRGRLELEVRSRTPPVEEGAGRTRRRIGIACFDARLAD